MAAKLQAMDPVDAAWYHMDGATNLAMVTGVVLTGTPLDFERVKAVYAHRLLPIARFRQRVVETGLPYPTPHWQEDPHFNIDDHFHHVALPESRAKQALPDLLSDIASTPLDYRRPLWQIHVVDCLDGGSAAILRFHHCVGDGTAMMAIAQLLFDEECGAPLDRAPAPLPLPRTGLLDALARPVGRLLEQSAQAVGSGANLLLHPSQTVKFVQLAAQSAGVAVGTLLKTPDPQSPLKGKLGVPKRVAWSEPIALDAVKAVGKATNAKVNDVLVATLAGALRRYLQARGSAQPGMIIRAIVPVDLRTAGRAMDLGNRFGLVFLDLPVGTASPLERLHATQQAMGAIKRSPRSGSLSGHPEHLWSHAAAGGRSGCRHLWQQGDVGFDQRRRPPAAALSSRLSSRQDDLLGAASRRTGNGNQYPQLRWRCDGGDHVRRRSRARSGADHGRIQR